MKPFDKATVLAVDSVHSELMIALVKGGEVFVETNPVQKAHDKNLNTMVRALLTKTKTNFGDIDAYAVVVGPGSWTGCRVGVAAIKGFNAGHAVPVVALNSLDIIERAAHKANGAKMPTALRSNLDNYFIKRKDTYSCEKLTLLDGFATLESIGADKYHETLIAEIEDKYKAGQFHNAKTLVPFYITDFEIKS